MLSFFKNSKGNLLATQTGLAINMEDVPDPMFSEKMLGDGFAIIPSNENVYSPIDGEITSIYEGSNHCYGITSKDGLEILIHIGIDTVNLKDNTIQPKVNLGQKIKAGELIAVANLNKIIQAGLKTHTMLIITNLEKLKSFELSKQGNIEKGESIFTYSLA